MPAYSEERASPALSPWVEGVWRLDTETAVDNHRISPDGCLDIIYRRGAGLLAVGAMTAVLLDQLPKGAFLAGIRFRPGMARPFFGLSAAELTDRVIPLADLWPSAQARELTNKLDDAGSLREAMGILSSDLPIRVGQPNAVQRVIAAIVRATGTADLNYIAQEAGLSARQFRRRCLEESGLTPKLLCRILRFRNVLRTARAMPRPNWATIAADTGYFDQAHLIRDFRQFARSTPMALFSNTPEHQVD